ncbi:unnamed protein product [Brachionus calyciflorus]|uniref:Uncharacterized protein n=1 Tax=Brachionus calyciflorus TaxID=104777 RepID=A0A813P3J4_9BILA|nr:unnamed protein product [Brachionus calyciflorus]
MDFIPSLLINIKVKPSREIIKIKRIKKNNDSIEETIKKQQKKINENTKDIENASELLLVHDDRLKTYEKHVEEQEVILVAQSSFMEECFSSFRSFLADPQKKDCFKTKSLNEHTNLARQNLTKNRTQFQRDISINQSNENNQASPTNEPDKVNENEFTNKTKLSLRIKQLLEDSKNTNK